MFKKPSHFEWLIKIFSHKKIPHPNPLPEGEGNNLYELITEVVKENSFPISKIEKELKAT